MTHIDYENQEIIKNDKNSIVLWMILDIVFTVLAIAMILTQMSNDSIVMALIGGTILVHIVTLVYLLIQRWYKAIIGVFLGVALAIGVPFFLIMQSCSNFLSP